MRDLETSLRELRTDYIDLWQLHNVCNMKKWREVTAPGGALEAAKQAKEAVSYTHLTLPTNREV